MHHPLCSYLGKANLHLMNEVDVARRARAVIARASHLTAGVLGHEQILFEHAVSPAGEVITPAEDLAGPCIDRLRAGEPSPLLTLVATDVSPVPQPDRLRAQVTVVGRARLGIMPRCPEHGGDSFEVAVLAPERVSFTDHSTGMTHEVCLATYVQTAPDPIDLWESTWLHHLGRDHSTELMHLVVDATNPDETAYALGADRHGLTFRVTGPQGRHDLTVLFPEAAPDPRAAVVNLGRLAASSRLRRERESL